MPVLDTTVSFIAKASGGNVRTVVIDQSNFVVTHHPVIPSWSVRWSSTDGGSGPVRQATGFHQHTFWLELASQHPLSVVTRSTYFMTWYPEHVRVSMYSLPGLKCPSRRSRCDSHRFRFSSSDYSSCWFHASCASSPFCVAAKEQSSMCVTWSQQAMGFVRIMTWFGGFDVWRRATGE